MYKKLLAVVMMLVFLQNSQAQNRYIIQLKNKSETPFSFDHPEAFLSQKALQRRSSQGIALDSTDLPVTPRYIDSIKNAGAVALLNVSKWLNAVTIQTTDAAALNKINNFSFVQNTAPIAARELATGKIKFTGNLPQQPAPVQKQLRLTGNFFNYGFSLAQIDIHNGSFLHNLGLRGQGMTLAMIDAGYNRYLTLKAFDSIRANNQIKDTWDFVAGEASVDEDHVHGMQCLSTIAANIPGQFVGSSPKAGFLLYRSEDAAAEYPIEEHNWVCAAERADSLGADVISSSLGYYDFDAPLSQYGHTYANMDGNTTMAARGADLAAKKGLLVVTAAGNEGNNSWGKIVTPADGDSVLAVGAVTKDSVAAAFTSRGPSSDGRVKPDVASVGVGTIIQFNNNTIGGGNGTSFATPNLAGLVTCLWQGFPELNNMAIIDAVRKSGSRFKHPNDTIGYGIPDMKKAVLFLLKNFSAASATSANCKATINWQSKDVSSMKYEIERKLSGQSSFIKIAEHQGTGASFSTHNYTFTDDVNNASAGLVTYRIKQIIDTATSAFFADYIDTVLVNVEGCNNLINNSIILRPNPASDKVSVQVTTNTAVENLVIRLFDVNGKLVFIQRTSKQSGTAVFELPLVHLAGAKYFASVYDGDKFIGTRELLKL